LGLSNCCHLTSLVTWDGKAYNGAQAQCRWDSTATICAGSSDLAKIIVCARKPERRPRVFSVATKRANSREARSCMPVRYEQVTAHTSQLFITKVVTPLNPDEVITYVSL